MVYINKNKIDWKDQIQMKTIKIPKKQGVEEYIRKKDVLTLIDERIAFLEPSGMFADEVRELNLLKAGIEG